MEQSIESLDFNQTLSLLSFVIDLIEGYPVGHGHAVANLCKLMSESFGLKFAESSSLPIVYAALLHDIGKYKIKEEILKKETSLNREETLAIYSHPVDGVNSLNKVLPLKDALWVIRWHHENIDGSGYPDNLAGDQIPLEAKILSIADAFVSMLTPRPYKEALKTEDVLSELSLYSNSRYEPKLFWILKEIMKRENYRKLFEVVNSDFSSSINDIFTFFSGEPGYNDKSIPQLLKLKSTMIDSKSIYKLGHSERVADMSYKIAAQMKLSEEDIKNAYLAGLMHDIGMLTLSTALLDKERRLTNSEFEDIQKHPGKTFEILKLMPSLKNIPYYCYCHHERIDGSGYPEGIRGEEIPLISKIIAVADSFDAMTSLRSYRRILPEDIALSEIRAFSGTQFDQSVVNALFRIKKGR